MGARENKVESKSRSKRAFLNTIIQRYVQTTLDSNLLMMNHLTGLLLLFPKLHKVYIVCANDDRCTMLSPLLVYTCFMVDFWLFGICTILSHVALHFFKLAQVRFRRLVYVAKFLILCSQIVFIVLAILEHLFFLKAHTLVTFDDTVVFVRAVPAMIKQLEGERQPLMAPIIAIFAFFFLFIRVSSPATLLGRKVRASLCHGSLLLIVSTVVLNPVGFFYHPTHSFPGTLLAMKDNWVLRMYKGYASSQKRANGDNLSEQKNTSINRDLEGYLDYLFFGKTPSREGAFASEEYDWHSWEENSVNSPKTASRKNVSETQDQHHLILILLESTRADFFRPGRPEAPFLARLAGRPGAFFTDRARTAVPNTNKSLFQALCGLPPHPLPEWLEYDLLLGAGAAAAAAAVRARCLPATLRRLGGHRSLLVTGSQLGALQAFGFERTAALADWAAPLPLLRRRPGRAPVAAAAVAAADDDGGEGGEARATVKAAAVGDVLRFPHGDFMKVNYLGIDDRATINITIEFLLEAEKDGLPGFVTVNTLLPHHTPGLGYHIPPDCRQQAEQLIWNGKKWDDVSDKEKYRGALLCQDIFLGELYNSLHQAELLNRTSFVLAGDHGESFPEDRGLDRHGGSAWDEGLRVPVLVAPRPPPAAAAAAAAADRRTATAAPAEAEAAAAAKGRVAADRQGQNWQLIDLKPTVLGVLGFLLEDNARNGNSSVDFDAEDGTKYVTEELGNSRKKCFSWIKDAVRGRNMLSSYQPKSLRPTFSTNHFGARQIGITLGDLKVVGEVSPEGRRALWVRAYNIGKDPAEARGWSLPLPLSTPAASPRGRRLRLREEGQNSNHNLPTPQWPLQLGGEGRSGQVLDAQFSAERNFSSLKLPPQRDGSSSSYVMESPFGYETDGGFVVAEVYSLLDCFFMWLDTLAHFYSRKKNDTIKKMSK